MTLGEVTPGERLGKSWVFLATTSSLCLAGRWGLPSAGL